MMPHLKGGLSCKSLISSFNAVVFHHTVVCFLLTPCCAGQSQLVGPSQPIVAIVGDDIILPCHLEPAVDASGMTLEWTRPDLNPRFVHVWRDGVELEGKKHPSYRGRTSLFVNNLKHGDISLKLSKVKLSDEGKYRCFIPTKRGESTVELVVGVISTIAISLERTETDEDISGLVLQCESKGWYPEPEVLWLDSEGNVLSAGPTETVRGPDYLYTVSSRVTVEKRHSNSFTCRVQQRNINQTRETQIRIPEDVFMVQSSSTVLIIVAFCVFGFLVFSVAFFVFWKLKQTKSHNKMHHRNEAEAGTGEKEQLITGSTTVVVLGHKKLEEKEEEKKVMMYVITVLMEQKKELENSKNKLRSQLGEVEREMKENEKNLESVHSELWNKDSKRKKLSDVKSSLDNKKTEYEKSLQSTEERLQETVYMITRITEWKKNVDNQIEQMKAKTDDTETRRDEIELQSEQSEREEERNKTTDSLTLIDGYYTQHNDAQH